MVDTIPPLPSLQTPPEPPAAPTFAHQTLQVIDNDVICITRIPLPAYRQLLALAMRTRMTCENLLIAILNEGITRAKDRAANRRRSS